MLRTRDKYGLYQRIENLSLQETSRVFWRPLAGYSSFSTGKLAANSTDLLQRQNTDKFNKFMLATENKKRAEKMEELGEALHLTMFTEGTGTSSSCISKYCTGNATYSWSLSSNAKEFYGKTRRITGRSCQRMSSKNHCF